MSTPLEPYVLTHEGDLITAKLFNGVQSTIREDLANQIKKAIEGIKTVDQSGDSAKLGGKTPKEIEDAIIQRALSELPKRTGYQMIFKRLTRDREKVIEHKLKACPLVDIYELDYFPVICAKGDHKEDQRDAYVNFYLYHSRENKFTSISIDVTPKPVFEIEPTDGKRRPFRIPFPTMLDLYKVPYTDSSSLEDLETEFWKALFNDPNDEFDEDQYCHSPWFEKCCGEQRTVATLKSRGNWNDIMFQMRPRKVVHVPKTPTDVFVALEALPSAQTDIMVAQLDFESISVRLVSDPVYPASPAAPNFDPALNVQPNLNDAARKELKVMLLLKV